MGSVEKSLSQKKHMIKERDLIFKSGDEVSKSWFLFAFLWAPIFTTFGLILAIKFFDPTFLGSDFILTFGRIRPAHVNGILFGFLSSALIGTMFYVVPRLCDSPLHNPRLAKILPLVWNLTILIGIIMLLFGYSQGREYAEFPWVIDVTILITLVCMSYLILSTIIKRKEQKLYVSVWWYSGVMLWFPIIYFVGNVMWMPPEGALSGTLDAVFNWYYGHNVLGFWFTPFGIAAWYFTIPIIIKRPLYSHRLSLISFFTLAFFYTGVGAHHILQAPIPEWLKTIAVTTSVLMLIPVLTFTVNIGLTLRGHWSKTFENIPLRFIVSGFVMYGLTSIQGSFQALRSVNAYIHFSQWTVGHAHLALFGVFRVSCRWTILLDFT